MNEGGRLLVLAAVGGAIGIVGGWAIRRARTMREVPVPAPTTPAPARPSWTVLTPDELDRRYGPIRWTAAPTEANPEAIRIDNASEWNPKIVRVDLPPEWADLDPWKGKAKPGGWFHRDVAPAVRELIDAWRSAGLLGLVQSWGGDYNPRRVRGSSSRLSAHAYGVAFDVNPGSNPLGLASDPARAGSVDALVSIARDLGWYWGGWFTGRPDPMHFEYVGKDGGHA